jgi:DNA-binding GntR family transcriptional regulator
LSRRLKAISRAILRKAYFESTEADLDFHRYIWEQSGNRTLFCMLDQLSAPLFAYSGLVRRRMGLEEMQNTVPRHEQIIAALRTRDPQIIEHAIRGHIGAAFGQLLKISLVSPDSVTGSESPSELQLGSHR